MRRTPIRQRPSYDDYYGDEASIDAPGDEASIDAPGDEVDRFLDVAEQAADMFYALAGTSLTLDPRMDAIEVTVTKDTESFIPGIGYFVDVDRGISGTKIFCFTLWGARRRAHREYDRMVKERDGRSALLTLKDDPANPPLTYSQEKAIRREAEMAAWNEMAAAIGNPSAVRR